MDDTTTSNSANGNSFAPFGDYYGYERPSTHQRSSRRRRNTTTNRGRAQTYGRSRGRANRRVEPLLFRYLGPMTSRRRNLVLFGSLGVISLAWFLTPASDMVTDLVLHTVPIYDDIELGRKSLTSLNRKYPPVRDSKDRYGVQRIGWDLVKALDERTGKNSYIEWDFSVVRAPIVNAFALPGGIVRVTDSLLQQLRLTDAEIAALIGHEMGHVLHRHSQKRLIKQRLFSFILGAIVYEDHDGHDETFGEAVSELMLKGATYLGEQSFSRKDEYEADAKAWDVLVASEKYDPRAVQGMLSKLWSLEGGDGKTSWESTHPGTADRIQALQEKWDKLGYREKKVLSSYPIS